MKQIKVLVIPAAVSEPVRVETVNAGDDDYDLDEAVSRIITGHPDRPIGSAGFNRTMLMFDEVAGDYDHRDEIINPRANELWNDLAAKRGSALSYAADEEPLYGTFVAVGRGNGSAEYPETSADVSEEIVNFPFRSA